MEFSQSSDLKNSAKESTLSPRFTELGSKNYRNDLSPNFSDVTSDLASKPYSPNFSRDLTADENGYIKTRNADLNNGTHPVTDVPFREKEVVTDTGELVTGVFPEFNSKFDAQLPKDMYTETDSNQFAECNKQLKEKVLEDPEFAKMFNEEQLEQIMNGDTPDGYTWHHNEEAGKMQLVDSEIHARTGHTGGRSIWGGGNGNR